MPLPAHPGSGQVPRPLRVLSGGYVAWLRHPAAGPLLEPEEGQGLPVCLQAAHAPCAPPWPSLLLTASLQSLSEGQGPRACPPPGPPPPEPGGCSPLLEPELAHFCHYCGWESLLGQREVQGTLGDRGHIFLRGQHAGTRPAPPGPGGQGAGCSTGLAPRDGPILLAPSPRAPLRLAPTPTSSHAWPPPPLRPGPDHPSRLVPTAPHARSRPPLSGPETLHKGGFPLETSGPHG